MEKENKFINIKEDKQVLFDIAKITKNRDEIVNSIKDILDYNSKEKNPYGKKGKFVSKDGWRALAGSCGLYPEIIKVEEIVRDNKIDGFNSYCILKDINGNIVSRSEGYCGFKEKPSLSENSVRSMSQTRSITRAISNILSFMLLTHGYETVPLEEIDEDNPIKTYNKENDYKKKHNKTDNQKTEKEKLFDYFIKNWKKSTDKFSQLKPIVKKIWDMLKPNKNEKMKMENIPKAMPFIIEWYNLLKKTSNTGDNNLRID